MKKYIRTLGKCWECHYPEYVTTKRNPAKNRISRKQKKELKTFLASVIYKMLYYNFDDPCSCRLRLFYKEHKKMFGVFKGLHSELEVLNSKYLQDQCVAPVSISPSGRLSWQWESDDDYGGTSGIMPFCYTAEEAKNTWAFSEVKDLFYYLYKGQIKDIPAGINSDKALLIFLRQNPIPEIWPDDDY